MSMSQKMLPPPGHQLLASVVHGDQVHFLMLAPSTRAGALLVRLLTVDVAGRRKLHVVQEPVLRDQVVQVVDTIVDADWDDADCFVTAREPEDTASWRKASSDAEALAEAASASRRRTYH
ncbi:hypothetical protein [Rhodoplanes roseus]|uniref:Uncharacterized protein n=1 Tax=Rhodoplanes roseus TaxID=29409 RepID=A0A327KYI6_9BRAD|nr:hypothetical protein [Rhodoplanes roseus]RAI42645.1 hypothetical protein CH341_18470 [Rhodoplanes roseus]